jgi:D-alanyl-D-alanine carboxypeptidase
VKGLTFSAVVVIGAVLWSGCADDEPGPTMPAGDGGAGGATTTTVGGGGGGEVVVEEDPYEPPPEVAPLPDAAVAAVGASIDGILGDFSGQTHSILIMGAETGQVIYERDPDAVRKPASNTKLFTSAAAMTALGDQHRTPTTVYATSAPAGGVIDGDLIVLGQHDFTWSTHFYAEPQFPLRQIAEGLAAQGITQVTGTAQARGEFLFEGYHFGTYDPAAERAVTAGELAAALADAGIAIGGTSVSPELTAPAGGVELMRWRSLPLDVGCSPLNRISHNEFADILSRHLGWVAAGDSSYDGGEAQVIGLLETSGADVSEMVLNDGSGLSHGNRVAARHVVALFDLMDERPEGLAWERTFSVAGVHGTIGGRLGGADTAGRFFGKTGTLSDTIALSGILEHAHDGQRYWLSMLMNGVTSSSAARSAHDQIVQVMASDLRGESDVPPAPVLQSVVSDGNGQSITATWTDVADVDGYLVWRSVDGAVWRREDARFVTPNVHRTLPFDAAERLYVRISAVRGIFESAPSDVYAARVGDGLPALLLVDGNDRWEAQPSPENHLGIGHDFMARYAEVLDVPFDTCANEAVVDGACPAQGRAALVWALGEESVDDLALSAEEQALIETHTAGGGAIVISGAELGYQLAEDPVDLAFLEDVLHTGYVGDDAGTYGVTPVDGGPVAVDQVLSFLTPDRMLIRYPDQLQPLAGAVPLFDYVGGAGGVAGVQYDGDHRAVTVGFPLESIDNREDRRAVVEPLLAFAIP